MDPREAGLRRAVAGDRRALARGISWLESGRAGEALARLDIHRHQGPGRPQVVGITGPPGAGKSSFTDRLIGLARARGQRVAVVAVDPSSPFTGGAILGDRVRMERHAEDDGVYIRSLSSRGSLGGLSRCTGLVVDLLDAAGFDLVIVETVGVGQGELAVMEVADSVLVVLTPESGDAVQAMKAGLLEIADVFVVNKADRPGAAALARELELSVHLDDRPGWPAPVHTTTALTGQGVDAVLASLSAHHAWCRGPGRAAWEARRAEGRVRAWLDRVADEARARALAEHPERVAGLRAGSLRPESTPTD